MSSKEHVCVLYGGNSDERAISIRSGKAIMEALVRQGVSVTGVDAKNGYLKELQTQKPDLIFIALHGKGGEDGEVQKCLDRLRIPYVGSTAQGSQRAFDKAKAKRIFKKQGIPTPKSVVLTQKNWKQKLAHLSPPIVIKPICNGSSIGITMVESVGQLAKAVESSCKQYSIVLAEQKVVGREFTVGILDGKALPVIELKPKHAFYDFEAKYTPGLTDYLVPAPISDQLKRTLQMLAERTHAALGLRDFSRVDFMVDSGENPYVLEANSIPGFTETSLLPKAARVAGLEFDQLCLKLLELAKRRLKGSLK
ncbi:MAG: D-alanine--D-alanine ligase [Candidatus Omnitrophica bacterium]|nr:D-alanine--D-alanine ligase [Candidatus Omnitrophota bacterium]